MASRSRSSSVRWGRRLLAAAALLLASIVPAAGGGEPAVDAARPAEAPTAAPAVRITTDAGLVASCRSVGEAILSGDDAFALLRQEAVRRGADVVLLTSLAGRDFRGRLYRCASAEGARPTGRTGGVQTETSPAVSAAESKGAVAPAGAGADTGGGSGFPPPTASPLPGRQGSPSPVPGPVSPPPARGTSSPRDSSPPPTDRAAASRRFAGERQRRAQEEFLDLQAAVRITEDPKLVEGCEKRGEGSAAGEDSLTALRGDAVGQLANAVLFHRTAERAVAVFFRCPARTLQAIPVTLPDSAH